MDEEKKDNLEEKVENNEEVISNENKEITETNENKETVEEKVETSNKENTDLEEKNEETEKVESIEEKTENVASEDEPKETETVVEESNSEEKNEESSEKDEFKKEPAEEKAEEKSEEEFVPEQLDDDEFEKEKEQAKADKKAKKLAKKEQKENGQTKKKSRAKLLLIIALIIASIGVIAAYFIINLNKPENVVNDFSIYFNKADWKSLEETIDWQGFLTLALIDDEATAGVELGSEDEVVVANYMDYDARYKTVYEDLEKADLKAIGDFIKQCSENAESILGLVFDNVTMKINKISSVEKIENTESLYKIKADVAFVEDGNEAETQTIDIYVAKNGEQQYKIVGGQLPMYVYNAFILYVQYFSAS